MSILETTRYGASAKILGRPRAPWFLAQDANFDSSAPMARGASLGKFLSFVIALCAFYRRNQLKINSFSVPQQFTQSDIKPKMPLCLTTYIHFRTWCPTSWMNRTVIPMIKNAESICWAWNCRSSKMLTELMTGGVLSSLWDNMVH